MTTLQIDPVYVQIARESSGYSAPVCIAVKSICLNGNTNFRRGVKRALGRISYTLLYVKSVNLGLQCMHYTNSDSDSNCQSRRAGVTRTRAFRVCIKSDIE